MVTINVPTTTHKGGGGLQILYDALEREGGRTNKYEFLYSTLLPPPPLNIV